MTFRPTCPPPSSPLYSPPPPPPYTLTHIHMLSYAHSLTQTLNPSFSHNVLSQVFMKQRSLLTKQVWTLLIWVQYLKHIQRVWQTDVPYWGFPTRMVYLYYIACLRYTILVGNPRIMSEMIFHSSPTCYIRLLRSPSCVICNFLSFATSYVSFATSHTSPSVSHNF